MLDRPAPRKKPERPQKPSNIELDIEVSILTALRGAIESKDTFLAYMMATALEHINQEQLRKGA